MGFFAYPREKVHSRVAAANHIAKCKERTGIAADSHPPGTPEATGVERLWPRENGQRVSGGEWEGTD
jgi:hypothetical protein